MMVRFTKKSIIFLMVLSIIVSLMMFPLPLFGGYQFPKPSTVWADDFRNGLDANWGNFASGTGTITISNTTYHSSPSSIRINSYSTSSAVAVGPPNKMVSPNSNGSLCSIDYAKNYTVELYFYLPTTNNHGINVFKNRHIMTIIDAGTNFSARWGGTNHLIIKSLNVSTWYRVTYWVDPPDSKYYVDVFNTNLNRLVVTGFQCTFSGESSRDPFELGSGASTVNYGEAYWDDFRINFVSLQITNVVFRLLAVEGYYSIDASSEIPNKDFSKPESTAPNYTGSTGQQIPMKSSQYLILALTQFINWKNWTWGGVKYTSYIHLLSYDPNRFAAANQYYRGESNRANVVNEIQNFLGQNDPNAYTVRMFHYAGHASIEGMYIYIKGMKVWVTTNYYLALGNPDNPEKLYASDLNMTLNSGALNDCSSVLVILDCCHSGGFIPALAKKGRVILAACKADQLAGGWAWLQAPAPAPGYWSWFTGNEVPWPAAKAVGIINALFKATDADHDGWLTASEIFDDGVNGASTTTMGYWALPVAQRPQNPQKSYGVLSGELPIVMSNPWLWIAQLNPHPPPNFYIVQTPTGFHPNPLSVTVQPQPPSKIWGGYRSDMSRTGFSSDPPLAQASLLWSRPLLNPIESSIVTKEEGVIASRKNGVVSMLDIRTGNMLWSLNLNGSIFSTPTIMNGTVFVGTMGGGGGGGGGAGGVASLYAIEFSTGIVMWNYTFPPETSIYSSPAVSKGRVFVGVSRPFPQTSWLCAFNQTTGMPLWNYTTYTPIWSSPAVADGRVFFAEYGNYAPPRPATFYALNENSGTINWNLPISGNLIVSTPAVLNGRVFIGTKSTLPGPSEVVAINELSGSMEWSSPTIGPVSSSPAVDPNTGLVVVGDEAGFTYGLTQTSGGGVWSTQLSPYPVNMSSAAISNNRLVFIGSTDNKLYCLNETNGQKLWNYTTAGKIVSSPAIVGDHVLIGSTDGSVYCFGPPFPLHDVAVTSASASPSVVTSGDLVTINFTLANNGNVPETFNVTFSYNNTELWTWPVHREPTRIGSNTVTLGPGATLTTAYSWNTAGIQRGKYTVVVMADYLTYETNDSNNIFITNTFTVEVHDVAVVNVDNMKSGCVPMPTVCQGMPVDIYVTVKNKGDYTETFDVTAYANTTIFIGKQKVTLDPGQNTTLTFTWDTTGLAEYKNYTVSATADQVPGETNLAGNTLSDGTVTITHMGDVTGDGKVDVDDIASVAGAFGSLRVNDPKDSKYGQYWHPTPCKYCPHQPNTDVTGDGLVDVDDLSRAVAYYGWYRP